MKHWTNDFSLYDALQVADIVGYGPDVDVYDKADFILGLASYMILDPDDGHYAANVTAHDFLVNARGACGRSRNRGR